MFSGKPLECIIQIPEPNSEATDKIPLSNELKIIYQIIGEVNVEYYFDNWILMSLNDVYKHYTEFKKQNQDNNESTLPTAHSPHQAVAFGLPSPSEGVKRLEEMKRVTR